jgi:hypothetical protein
MLFNEFCDLVPSAANPVALAANAPLNYIVQGLADFVAPKLKPRLDVNAPQQPRVLVVSAPGAVGKSTLARELSRVQTLPYWDLAHYGPVGQGTIVGALGSAFGFAAMGQIQEQLARGQLAFVIDALDEARVKVNEPAFEAFVRDIAQNAKASPTVSFVLFGRNQIAETSWLVLSEAGVDVGFYVIEAFERAEANQYVDRRVSRLSVAAAQRMQTHPQPYYEARDLILDGLQHAIAGSQPNEVTMAEARDFVGYAPVLDAVAVLLAGEANWGQLRSRVQSEADGGLALGGANRPVALLRTMVRRILEREQEAKLVTNIKPALQVVAQQAGWSDWDSLYSAEEQCERLVSKLLGIPYRASYRLPLAVAAQYEQRLAAWLPEHPFLREGNSVFTSYLFATSVLGTKQREAVEAHLAGRGYKPSRLFADFYFLEIQPRNGAPLTLPPQHVGLLYDALLAGESDRFALRTTLEGDDEDQGDSGEAQVDGEFELVDLMTIDDDEPRIASREFVVTVSAADVLRFRRYLRDATIMVPCGVELGSGTGEFEIGPAVSIHARTLHISAASIIVGGRTKIRKLGEEHDNGVVLEADHVESSVVEQPVTHVKLTVSWPGCEAFPWSAHASQSDPVIRQDARLRRAYIRFRRILMTLRSHSKGSLARVRHKIEHTRVLQGAMGEALLRRLVADGILTLRGNFYHLVPNQADPQTGISWMELRHGRSSDRLRLYLHNFVQANLPLFA